MLSRDVEKARAWAEKMHRGQTDKSGNPYIGHPERVAGRLKSPEEQVVGWLHDTVEDTEMTLSEIEGGFGPETTAAVDAISRRDGEEWDDYLKRVKQDPVARRVKISDLIDNSNLSRLAEITMRDVERQAKYNRALKYMMTD